MFKIIVIFLIVFFVPASNLNADVNSDLREKNAELSKIKQDINKKKSEKHKLQKQEKRYKREIANLDSAISRREKQLKKIAQDIGKTEKELAAESQKYASADEEKNELNKIIQKQYFVYAKKKLYSYYGDPLEYKMRECFIRSRFDRYNDAKNREMSAQNNIRKYSRAKKELVGIKSKQQTIVHANKTLKSRKNRQLKAASSERMKADREITALRESAQALSKLIEKLTSISKRIKKASASRSRSSIRSASNTRKNNLPWPADGPVILNYGKNKHPELDTNIISNGIKIKTQNNAIIKSVEKGRVAFVGEFRSYGKMIIIDHNGEFFSVYAQLAKILVKEEENVARGGAIARSGEGDTAVLYFEIRQANIPENPKLWLKEKR